MTAPRPSEPLSPLPLEDTLESLLGEHGTAGRRVYLATVGLVVSLGGAAASASVDVGVRAPGVLQPALERQTLRSGADGEVRRIAVAAGGHVHRGDTLLVLADGADDRSRRWLEGALGELRARRRDWARLLAGSGREGVLHPAPLAYPPSIAAAEAAAVEWREQTITVERTERTRDRLRTLAKRGFATPAELEGAELDANQARSARALAVERARASWARELAALTERIAEVERELGRHVAVGALRVVTAPVGGYVEQAAALTPGTRVRAGEAVATISPDTLLVVETLVAPRDVRHLRVGMPARLLIEGYDVQEWGAAAGEVTAVADDYSIAEGAPVFRVRVRPLSLQLRRRDGRTARLSKGLRCQVRIVAGRHRLGALMLRRVGEWLDPPPAAPAASGGPRSG